MFGALNSLKKSNKNYIKFKIFAYIRIYKNTVFFVSCSVTTNSQIAFYSWCKKMQLPLGQIIISASRHNVILDIIESTEK